MKLILTILSIFSLLSFSIAQASTAIETIFQTAYFNQSIYIENRCQDNVARFMVLLRNSGINIENLSAIEITNPGNEDRGMVAGQRTRGYQDKWFHHVVMFDGKLIYDFDFMKQPTVLPAPRYFHEMFKSEKQKHDRVSCDKTLGRYQIVIRPSALYLNRYRKESLPAHYTQITSERQMSKIAAWGCDFSHP